MLKRSFALLICVAALAACGPSAESQTAAAPRVSDVACESAGWDRPADAVGLERVSFTIDSPEDDPAGALEYVGVSAPAGSTCGAEAGVLTCQLRGPIAEFAIQDTQYFRIAEGRTATFRYAYGEGATCFLNEAG